MEVVYLQCAGLDVHRKTVVAAIIVAQPNGELRKETRTFGTMTADLLTLSDWLIAEGATHVAMESTGEYWKPVFNILEANFEVWSTPNTSRPCRVARRMSTTRSRLPTCYGTDCYGLALSLLWDSENCAS
jgi:hypothetical protein